MSWSNSKLSDICSITTGKWDANHAVQNGKYKFYTCANEHTYCDTKRYKGKNIILPGNGANVGRVYFYDGEFDAYQRTYVLSDIKILPEFLFYHLKLNWESRNRNKQYGSATNFLKIGNFNDYEVSYPSFLIQEEIVSKLDAIFTEIEKAAAATEANIKNAEALYQSYLKDIFEHGKENWKAVKLNEIAEYFNGLTYSPKDVSDSGIIVLRSSNVQDDKLDFNDIVRVNLKVKDKIIVRDGDILMCSRNGSKRLVGKTATIMNLSESMTFGTFMMIVRSKFNPFLEWFFKSNTFKKQISGGEVTMINQITRYLLDSVSLHLPEDNEIDEVTKKISDIFSQSRELKSSYLAKLSELNAMKRSILNHAFNPVN